MNTQTNSAPIELIVAAALIPNEKALDSVR